MSNNFKGSIAQDNVQFPIETVIEPMAGENYSKAVIYMPLSKVAEYLPGANSVDAGTMVEVNSSNYGSVTGGLLKTWLVPFFTSAQAVTVGIAVYNDTVPEEGSEEVPEKQLPEVYELTKYYAYFKFGIADTADYISLQVQLCNLCAADILYSRLWVGTSDQNVLSQTSSLVEQLEQASGSYRLIFNSDTTINPALAQLGKTLSTVNTTGTPVGNSVDMVAFNTISPSGTENSQGEATNLTPTQKTALDNQKIGYQTYVGDGTENVVTEGSLYSNGDSVGAEWVKAYITYLCKVKTANLITRMNKFNNNATYQSILLILQDIVKGFVNFGRLANFVLTAPVFADLPPAKGDTITVPNAWQADYIDNVRTVSVYGTLYITQSTR